MPNQIAETTKRRTICIHQDLDTEAEEFADAYGWNVSDVYRRALVEYLSRSKSQDFQAASKVNKPLTSGKKKTKKSKTRLPAPDLDGDQMQLAKEVTEVLAALRAIRKQKGE